MKQKNIFTLFFLLFGMLFATGQSNEVSHPDFIIQATEFKVIPPLSSMNLIPPSLEEKEVINERWLNYPTNFNALPKGKDPLVGESSKAGKVPGFAPVVNFDGAISGVHSGAVPPDPTGAVGTNHYIHSYNSGFVIFNKDGSIALAHASLSNIFPGQSLGDPIILFDRYAAGGEGRFVITEFSNSPNGLLVAVCQGTDPVNDGWFTYRFNTSSFPDYPKYSIWHDAYYVAANKGGDHFYAMEREKMIAGDDTAALQAFTLPGIAGNPNTVFSPLPMNSTGPTLPDASTPGYVVYLQDDAWAGGVDRLKLWEVDLDWDTPANSVITESDELATTPFDSFTAAFGSGEIPQPGTGQRIDGITGVVSFACNYYRFPSHNSVTLNFNVDVNGDNTVLGIRWYELRVDSGTWSIEQEGTYAPDDGLYRFMGSMAMDSQGNIGLAFSAGNATNPVSLRYTGRFANTTPGEMALAEETIVAGAGSQTFSNRYGDYAHLTLDPVDNNTFWYTSEYFESNNNWRSRVAAFKLAPDEPNDVGVTNITEPGDETLSNAESITIEIFNFGTDPQSDIPVSYQIDGGAAVNETFAGPLDPTSSATYTFTQTADLSVEGQTYAITASTNLAGDANTSNDPFTKNVTNLSANDIGVTEINTPASGTGLTAAEVVQVTVENFGGTSQSNFDVTYTFDGGAPVTEQVAGPLDPGTTTTFDFSATADLSSFGLYSISATTSLAGDTDTTNDAVSKTVNHASCIPESTSGCNIDGIKRFVLGTIDADDGGDGCNSTGQSNSYSDRTDLVTDLDRESGSNEHLLQAQHNWTGGATVELLSVWVDFNDDGVFDVSEQLIAGENFQVAEALSDFNLVIPVDAALGEHILRAKALDGSAAGDINDPCGDMAWGETQDYTVNIVDGSLSLDDLALQDADFNIYDRGNNNFELILKTSSFTDELVVTMHNVLGQRLVRNRVNYENGQYTYNLTLDGLQSGIYLVRIGNNNYGRVKRIVVK